MREIHFTLKLRASETTPKRTCVAPMKTARGGIVPAGAAWLSTKRIVELRGGGWRPDTDSTGRRLRHRTLRTQPHFGSGGRDRFGSEAGGALMLKVTYPSDLVRATTFIRQRASHNACCDQRKLSCMEEAGVGTVNIVSEETTCMSACAWEILLRSGTAQPCRMRLRAGPVPCK